MSESSDSSVSPSQPTPWWRLALVIAAAAVALVALHHYGGFKWMKFSGVVAWVDESRRSPWFVVKTYLFFLIGMLALPLTLFPVIGGVLLPFGAAFPLNVLAATVGGYLAFLIARFAGRAAIEPHLRGRVKSFDEVISSRGFVSVFLIRWFGVPPYALANYVLGLSGVKHEDFLLGTALGITPYMGLMTYASGALWSAIHLGGKHGFFETLWKSFWPAMVGSTVTTLALIGAILYRRYRKKKVVTDYSNL